MSAAVASTSSNTADHDTFASWLAPTTDSDDASTLTRNDGVLRRREICGACTSNPAATRRGPVVAIRSHASSALRITCPRCNPPGRINTGSMRSRRAISDSSRWRFDVAITIACSTEMGADRGPGAFTASSPRATGVGRIELHDQPLVRFGDEARPAFEPGDDLGADLDRRVERAAVEAAEHRFRGVARGPYVGRRCGNFDAAGAVAGDRVDHAGQRGSGERARRRCGRAPARSRASTRQRGRGAGDRPRRASSAPRTIRWSRSRSRSAGCGGGVGEPSRRAP